MPITEAGAALIGSGISAAAQLGSSVVKNRKSFKYSKKLAEFQNDINLRNWNLQNAYNSPQSQMARLKQAGLNPNLVYQNGGASTAAGDINAPSAGQFELENPYTASMSQFQNMLQALTQKDAVAAEIDRKIAETEGIKSDNIFKGEHAKYVSDETKYWLKSMQVNNEMLEQQKHLLTAQTGLTTAQTQEAVLRWNLVPAELNKLRSETRLNEKNMQHLDKLMVQIDKNNNLLTQQYQKAVFENSLLALQVAAEQGADQNTYDLMIRQLRAQVLDLEFRNGSIWRRHELNPSANVPEAINIYREYLGKDRIEDILKRELDQDWRMEDARDLVRKFRHYLKYGKAKKHDLSWYYD